MYNEFIKKCQRINPEEYQRNNNRISVPINDNHVQKTMKLFDNEDGFYLYNMIRRVCWLNCNSFNELKNVLIIVNDQKEYEGNKTFKKCINDIGLII